MSNEEDNIENLLKLFQEGLDLYNKIDKTNEPTNSSEVQADIKRAMTIFEKATRLASIAGLFSSNENVDEIATNDLQFIMLPALLGTLSLKLTSGERKEIVECAEIYFKDFLQRTNDYGLSDYTFKEQQLSTTSSEHKSDYEHLKYMVQTRQSKIQRYQEQKNLQSKLEELNTNMGNLSIDEDIKRTYILTMIRIFIYKAIEDIASIEMEKPMLDHMEKLKTEDGSSKFFKKEAPKPKPLRPVIITRDDVQKAVYGLGYPSLPTMTVKEFYDQRVKDGIFPDPTKTKKGPLSLQDQALAGIEQPTENPEDLEDEKKIEEDDPVMLQRLRDKDEYKDDHRRGWGNRMNRS